MDPFPREGHAMLYRIEPSHNWREAASPEGACFQGVSVATVLRSLLCGTKPGMALPTATMMTGFHGATVPNC